jgi:hypothetical protein
MQTSLEKIRELHVQDWDRPWPGANFGKVLVGRAINAALAEFRAPKKG